MTRRRGAKAKTRRRTDCYRKTDCYRNMEVYLIGYFILFFISPFFALVLALFFGVHVLESTDSSGGGETGW